MSKSELNNHGITIIIIIINSIRADQYARSCFTEVEVIFRLIRIGLKK